MSAIPSTTINEGSHSVFVYGTLKRGFHNHGLLAKEEFVGNATTIKTYDMHYTGGLPYVLESGNTSRIRGEAYLTDDRGMANLDRLEGHPSFYERRIIWIQPELGAPRKAWVYFLNEEGARGYADQFNAGTLVESGNHSH
ncbi:MAG: gamma-glutamylcyclotransferase [Myxococcales bacterium]|nr:gamma-glutamylcyclotransferase [Myxococcales bacterium]